MAMVGSFGSQRMTGSQPDELPNQRISSRWMRTLRISSAYTAGSCSVITRQVLAGRSRSTKSTSSAGVARVAACLPSCVNSVSAELTRRRLRRPGAATATPAAQTILATVAAAPKGGSQRRGRGSRTAFSPSHSCRAAAAVGSFARTLKSTLAANRGRCSSSVTSMKIRPATTGSHGGGAVPARGTAPVVR